MTRNESREGPFRIFQLSSAKRNLQKTSSDEHKNIYNALPSQKTRLPSDKKHSRGKKGDICYLKTEKELKEPHRMLFV